MNPRSLFSQVPRLDERLWFPDPRTALRRGQLRDLVAWGGDLSAARLVLAYRSGIFPWTENPITWWSPDPRSVIELDRLHVSRSLAKTLRRQPFRITVNQAFRQTIEQCAAPAPGRLSSWISPGFGEAYSRLHELGHAHSLECWLDGRLVGGIYGVAIGGLFAGESMFHRVTDASKVAVCHLVDRLRDRGFSLFDVQVPTRVTLQLGALSIPRDEYLNRLARAVALPCRFA